MSALRPTPYDRTVIMPDVPELPAEATLVLPINQPRPEEVLAALPAPAARRIPPQALVLGALLLLAGAGWWVLGGPSSAPSSRAPRAVEALADPLPPALRAYGIAADQGDPRAMRMLGASYTYGLGVRVNRAQGAAWYRKAAAAGDKMASQELALTNGGKP